MFFDLGCSPITPSSPRHNTEHQARKFVRSMLHPSSSCWTPISRNYARQSFWNEEKAPLKKLRNLELNLGRVSWRFRIWLRGLYSVNLISRIPIKRAANCKKRDKDLWGYLLAMRTFWNRRRKLRLARLQCVISWNRLQGLFFATLFLGFRRDEPNDPHIVHEEIPAPYIVCKC